MQISVAGYHSFISLMRIFTSLILILTSISSLAQNTAAIKGRVINANSGDPIPFATVGVWNTSSGSTSDANGYFVIKGLKPGYLKLNVSAVGFKNVITGEVLTTIAKTAQVEVALEETSINLNEVTIRANVFRKNIESPISFNRIGIEDIEKNPGGNRDISKVIQSFPGVSSTASFRNDLIVRGGGPSENRFYLDGVEIPTINHFSTQGASGGPVGIINVDFIREVNFYSSAFPSSKGDALSSVLDFKMIDGNKDELRYRATIGASDLGVTVDGPISENLTFIASVRRSYLQFLFQTLKLPFLPTYNDLQFKLKAEINDKQEFTIIGLGAFDKNRLNTSIKNPDDDQQFILNSLPENNQWNYTLGAVYKKYSSSGVNTWVLSRSHFYNQLYKHKNNSKEQIKMLDYSSSEIKNKLRYEHLRIIQGYSLGWGTNLSYNQYNNATYQLFYRSSGGDTINYDSKIRFISYGLFFNIAKSYFNETLSLSAGIRLDGNSFATQMANPLQQISPRLALSYNFIKNFYLNFNVGRYFQEPPLTIFGYKNSSNELINKKYIKYIQSDHIVAGLEFRTTDKEKLTIEGFYKFYKNYPFSILDSVSLSSKGGDFGVFGNEAVTSIAKGEAYGVEIMYQSKNILGFNVVSAYTLYWSKTKNYNKHIGIDWIPTTWDNRHLFTIASNRKIGKNWEMGFKWRYLGGAPFTPYDLDKSSLVVAYDAIGGLYLDYDFYNQKRLGSYNQLDFRVDKTYFFKKWSLNIYVDVQNVLNSKADEPDRYLPVLDSNGIPTIDPQDPNRYLLRRAKTGGSGTILPTIGVILDF